MIEALPYVSSMIVGVLSAVLTFLASEHTTKQKHEEAKAQTAREHSKQLNDFKTEIFDRIDAQDHKYNQNMNDLYNMITDIKATCQETAAVTEEKLTQLEKKQDKHNAVIERTIKLEARADVLEEKVKVANHRLDDIERHEEQHA